MSIADFAALERVLVVGSFLRKDHPLLAQRLRQAVRKGAQVSMVHVVADDWLMPIASSLVVPPALLVRGLAEIVVAAHGAAGRDVPGALRDIEPRQSARDIAAMLASGERRAILLGNYAEQHPQAAQLLALAQLLGELTGAKVGCLTEAANSVGGYAVDALPLQGGRNAQRLWTEPRSAYVVLNAEPELDCADPVAARKALDAAKFVVMLSPYEIGTQYADVILPIGPFTETAGTFVNCEGRMQRFQGVVRPRGEARPGWKVLRVIGSMLGLPGFEFETIDELRRELGITDELITARLDNRTSVAIAAPGRSDQQANGALERVADVPIHFADPIVRRAPSLQKTPDAKPPTVRMNASMLQRLGLTADIAVRVRQGEGVAVLTASLDPTVPDGAVRISAAHPDTAGLGVAHGAVVVERAS